MQYKQIEVDTCGGCPTNSEVMVEEMYPLCGNNKGSGNVEVKFEQVDIVENPDELLLYNEDDHDPLQENDLNDSTSIYRHSCGKCDFKATERSSIILHSKIHKNHRYFCKECNFKTFWEKNLQRHLKIHKDEYNCEECDFKTQWEHCLISHMNIHRGFNYFCYKCNFQTFWKERLRIHLKIHNDDYEYKCKHCNFKTRWKGCLKRHSKKHETTECNKI